MLRHDMFRLINLCLIFSILFMSIFNIITYGNNSVIFNVLWVYDPPFFHGNPEFNMLKGIIRDLSGSIVVKNAWEIWLLSDVGWADWLRGAGYDLVVISWSRSAYYEAVKGFLLDCLRSGTSVLILPGWSWNITEDLGLVMINTELFNANFSVVDHVVSHGIWIVGVSNSIGVISLYYRVNTTASYNVSWTPIALAPDGGASVVVGTFNYTRVAAIVPYLYAYSGYDNERLFRNIIMWLLGRDEEILREYEELGDWSSVAVKDLSMLRKNLLMEIQNLYMKKNKTLEELTKLNNTLNKLVKEYNVTNLIELKNRLESEIKELENEKNTTYSELKNLKAQIEALCEEEQRLRETLDNYRGLLRYGYRALGIGIAIGIVVGYIATKLAMYSSKIPPRKK